LIISGPPQQSDGVSAFDQSYRRLSSAAIGALTTLAAFRGGFTIDDAEAACPDNLRPNLSEIVADLRRAGLVVEDLSSRGLSNRNPHEPVSVSPKPGERLDLPRTVRRITEEQSASRSAAARDRHARHFAAMSAAAEIGLNGRDQARWVHRLSLERDNLSAALGWLASRDDPEQALAMAGALGRFWWLTGSFVEGQHALRSVLSRPGADRPTVGRASALHALGLATFWHETRPAQARASATQFSEAVTIYRRCGEQARLARAARDLGAQCNSVGDAGRAWQLLNESVTLARRRGDAATAGVSLAYLGIVASYQDKRTEARALLEEALVLLSGEGSDDEVIRAQFFLACLECDDGNPVAARARFAALVNGRQLIATLPYAAPFALDGLARLAAVENRYDDALGVYGAATAAHQRLGTSAGAGYARYRHRGLDAARDSCGTHAAALIDSGRRWSLPQAVELGLTTNQPRAEPLHSRQLDVLRLAEAGLADTQIARQLFLSPRTVSNHLSATYRRLGVHNRLAAVQRARHLGLL
jgi:DNA-binding CsgD family transcriptional regulator